MIHKFNPIPNIHAVAIKQSDLYHKIRSFVCISLLTILRRWQIHSKLLVLRFYCSSINKQVFLMRTWHTCRYLHYVHTMNWISTPTELQHSNFFTYNFTAEKIVILFYKLIFFFTDYKIIFLGNNSFTKIW